MRIFRWEELLRACTWFLISITIQYLNFPYAQDPDGKNYSGYCIDVFKDALESLGCDLPYEFVEFSGTYDELVKNVTNKVINLSSTSFPILCFGFMTTSLTEQELDPLGLISHVVLLFTSELHIILSHDHPIVPQVPTKIARPVESDVPGAAAGANSFDPANGTVGTPAIELGKMAPARTIIASPNI
ncbi:hypothetical protein RHSIM_Rhsim13G0184100 [Rhododendron simsii]|uniref:Uncharacterized protein n=1 Tax=Rhododendron simsii TaxID=118357 RepID=A0A834G2W2_RHOSS|nr:hypothetical protein RHSIM_Rhsim13G0184100 [Rhododendron simsii]